MKVIFVAGIHAVGKSTVCRSVSDELGIPHYTASQIIREEKSSAVAEGSKLVADVADNQRILIQGASRLLERGRFLLDGHFTMRRELDGGIEPIHADVFRDLRVGRVVLYVDDPEAIAKRMHDRDGVLHPVELFQSHQDAEISHARHVTNVLGLPMTILQAFDAEGMKGIVTEGS